MWSGTRVAALAGMAALVAAGVAACGQQRGARPGAAQATGGPAGAVHAVQAAYAATMKARTATFQFVEAVQATAELSPSATKRPSPASTHSGTSPTCEERSPTTPGNSPGTSTPEGTRQLKRSVAPDQALTRQRKRSCRFSVKAASQVLATWRVDMFPGNRGLLVLSKDCLSGIEQGQGEWLAGEWLVREAQAR